VTCKQLSISIAPVCIYRRDFLPKNPRLLVTVSQISVSITLSAPSHFQGPTILNLVFTWALNAQQAVILTPFETIWENDGAEPMSRASW
jgi:hypothetical protein